MSHWDVYPDHYRQAEVQALVHAARAGDCASVVGLSGSGKSNLLGFVAHRASGACFALVDCNRLEQPVPHLLWQEVARSLRKAAPEVFEGEAEPLDGSLPGLEQAVGRVLARGVNLCLLLDRFEVFGAQPAGSPVFGPLRALRDAFKYRLSLVTGTRRPLPTGNELAELVFGRTLWLGPLSEADAAWSIAHYAGRLGLAWDVGTAERIASLSGRYPAFLRAACEACSAGVPLELDALVASPPVRRRLDEFWGDNPPEEALRLSGLAGNALLAASRLTPVQIDETRLTAKERRLLSALRSRPGQVWEKDDLIRAVWTEDRVFEQGVRDDSLAQLVRRLREKIEPDPANPTCVRTVTGRGYIFHD